MNFNSIDTSSLAAVKKQIKDVQPIIASIPLAKFSFGRNKTILIEGTPLITTEDAYFKFIKRVLGAPPGFIKKFKNLTNEKTQISVLETLIAGNIKKIKGNVVLVGNPTNNQVTSFDTEVNSFKTHDQTIDFAERILNVYPNLEFRNAFVDESGRLQINARNSRNYDNNIVGEEHNGGISIINSYDEGCKIYHSLLRCVCTNGIVVKNDTSLKFNNTQKGIDKLFINLSQLDKNNWIDPKYWGNVNQAMELDASLAEVKLMRDKLVSLSDINQYNPEQLESFIPMNRIKKFLVKKGINYDKLTEEQMKNCPTNLKLWNLINKVTEFASHDYGFKIKDIERFYLQTAAGDLLQKKPDAVGFLHFN